MNKKGKICETCSRSGHTAATRSHSNIKSSKRQSVNLQWQRRGGVWARLCTNCIKTGQKVR